MFGFADLKAIVFWRWWLGKREGGCFGCLVVCWPILQFVLLAQYT